jgi:hypothetical protein
MTDIAKIEGALLDTLSREFPKVHILRVSVREESDWSDGDVLRIDVVFEGDSADINARKLASIVRHVRPQLTELGEFGFPLFSFIAKSDVGSRKRAPA